MTPRPFVLSNTIMYVVVCPFVSSWRRHQMKTFSALLAICAGIHRSPVNSPHKGQWRGALIFSLICVWINGWVNNREAGDLRRYRAHYDVTVMLTAFRSTKYDTVTVIWPLSWRDCFTHYGFMTISKRVTLVIFFFSFLFRYLDQGEPSVDKNENPKDFIGK